MSNNLKKFASLISQDKELRSKVEALGNNEEASKTFIINEAKKHGINITNEDFAEKTDELSKDEMAAVCGSGGCGCAISGGGGGDGLKCVCIFKSGTGTVNGAGGITSQGGCICYLAGAGATRRH